MRVRTLQTSFLMIVGTVILTHSLLNFQPESISHDGVHRGKHYQTEQKIWGAVGAGLIVFGLFIENRRRY